MATAAPRARGPTASTLAEKALLKAALAGEIAEIGALPERSRGLSAAFIAGLLRHRAAEFGPRGLRLRGARILGDLDLTQLGAAQPHAPALELLDCEAEDGAGLTLDLSHAALVALDLSGSAIARIKAPGLRLAADFRAEGVRLLAGAGIAMVGARIAGAFTLHAAAKDAKAGTLDLDTARIDGRVKVLDAHLASLRLRGATLGEELWLNRSRLGGLKADGAKIAGAVFLSNMTIEGETRLPGATIGGQLAIDDGATLLHAAGAALNADQATIQLGVVIDGKATAIDGATRLLGATIGGELVISDGATLRHAAGAALDAGGATIHGGLFIQGPGTAIEGETRLLSATIGGALSIRDGTTLRHPAGAALSADGATIQGGVFIEGNGTTIEGATRLLGASIGGQLAIRDGATLRHAADPALNAEGATIQGGVLIGGKGTAIAGATRLIGATIGGPLAIGDGATLRYAAGAALNAYGATIQGGVFLRDMAPGGAGCAVIGLVSLSEARIGRIIDLRGCRLGASAEAPFGRALEARGLYLDGDLRLGDASADSRKFGPACIRGTIRLDRARIEGALVLTDAELTPSQTPGEEHDLALSLEGARIGARIECHALPKTTTGIIDLRGAHTAFLDDQGGIGWGEPCAPDQPRLENGRHTGILLRLDGLTYDRLPDFEDGEGTTDPHKARDNRLAFLHRQYPGDTPQPQHFAPQPYEQVAKTLRFHGRPQEAEDIALEKRLFRTRCAVDRAYVRQLQRALDWGFGHFYKPLRAIRTLAYAVLAGLALLLLADAAGALVKKRTDVALTAPQLGALAQDRAAAPWELPREACWPPPPDRRTYALLVPFEAAALALDTFLPLVDLKQDQRCEIDWEAPWGRLFGLILALYAALGLVIIPLFIATVSGLAKRD